MEKFLAKLPAGWTLENATDNRGESFTALRFDHESGEFSRIRRFPDCWTWVLFNADGTGSYGHHFTSFKKLVEALND